MKYYKPGQLIIADYFLNEKRDEHHLYLILILKHNSRGASYLEFNSLATDKNWYLQNEFNLEHLQMKSKNFITYVA